MKKGYRTMKKELINYIYTLVTHRDTPDKASIAT